MGQLLDIIKLRRTGRRDAGRFLDAFQYGTDVYGKQPAVKSG